VEYFCALERSVYLTPQLSIVNPIVFSIHRSRTASLDFRNTKSRITNAWAHASKADQLINCLEGWNLQFVAYIFTKKANSENKVGLRIDNPRRKFSSQWLASLASQEVLNYAMITRCRPNSTIFIDYRCADKKRSWRFEGRHWRHLIGLDSLFQNTPIFTPPKNEPLSQEVHLNILHFSSGLKISGAVEKLGFTHLWNRCHQRIPGIKLIQIGAIPILLCQH
jgi:hypothetical protein